MLLKPGAFITTLSGSVGNQTIQKSKGGVQLRSKPDNVRKSSELQYRNRRFYSEIVAYWQVINESDRSLWNLVSKKPLSGFNLFVKTNFFQLSNDLPLLSSPYPVVTDPYGPELIQNGDFSDHTAWILSAGWSFQPGYVHYADTFNTSIRQPLVLAAGVSFRLAFSILFTSTYAYFKFVATGSGNLFEAPYDDFLNLAVGDYAYDVVTARVTDNFYILGSKTGGQFDLTNVSLKVIL